MNREDGRVIGAVASQAAVIAQAIGIIADRLRMGGRLIYVGAGTSGRLGVLDATECPPTFSSPPGQVVGVIAGGPTALTQAVEGAGDRPELAEQDLAALTLAPRDVLVSGHCHERGPARLMSWEHCVTLAGRARTPLACLHPQSDLEAWADLAITPLRRPRSAERIDAIESRHRHQAGAQHAQHGGHGLLGKDVR